MLQGYRQVSLGRRSACPDIPSASSPYTSLDFILHCSLTISNGAALHECQTRANYLPETRLRQHVSGDHAYERAKRQVWGGVVGDIFFHVVRAIDMPARREYTMLVAILALSMPREFLKWNDQFSFAFLAQAAMLRSAFLLLLVRVGMTR